MNTKLNYPVCGYQELAGQICPSCDTDTSIICRHHNLLPIEKTTTKKLELDFGSCFIDANDRYDLGSRSKFFDHATPSIYLYNANTSVTNSSVVSKYKSQKNTPMAKLPTSNIYIVKAGDNLSLIAEKFCPKANAWEKIVQANPQLQNCKDYYIDPGEELKITNCQERNE
ncbi:LysM peptidoglycan-binding domain-containing protein [Trichormus azollae]|uniref:LysM peptidoglycan-binding domain-containing protein n=1 Tax=Trichormus azollae TaxID=1164 RepID=UPI00325CB315